jgi:hypothetical protein
MSNQPMTGSVQEPKWVSSPTAAFPEDKGKAIYGVGIAEKLHMPDLYILRTSAEERARRAVAATLSTMVASIFKDYTSAAFTPSMKQGEIQSLTENVQKSVVTETLDGAEIMDHWTNPQTGDIYALCKLSMDSVAQTIRDKITAVEKDKLKMDAAAAHKELDQIIQDNAQKIK